MIQRLSVGERLKTDSPKPLTRERADGSGSQSRLPEIESEINSLLKTSWENTLTRMQTTDPQSEQWVSEEALVFFLRAAAEVQDREILNETSRTLLTRCQPRINGYVGKFNARPENFDEWASDLVGDLFIKLYDINSDVCDFAQVRFWSFLKRFCFNSLGKYKLRQQFMEKTDSINQTDSETGQAIDIEDKIKVYSSINNKDLKRGLEVLPEPIRTAYILRVGAGWQIDSIEPGAPTLSKYFGKTEKTIRNWLLRAENLLAEWRDDTGLKNK